MRTRIIISLFFLIALKSLRAQTFYISTLNGQVLLVDLAACTTTVVSTSALVFYDIAVCPGNPNVIYGIENGGMNSTLYTINATTGATTLLSNQFAIQFGGYPAHILNSLVCDGNGNLYAADAVTSTLYRYDIAAGTWSVVGSLGGQTSSGDLTFYNGELYLSTNANQLIQISLSPFGTNVVSSIAGLNIYGIQTIINPSAICASDGYSMIASADNDLYEIDPFTGTATPVCSDIIASFDFIAGGASLDESIISSSNTLTGTNPPAICPGDTANIIVSNSGIGNYSYVWSPGGDTTITIQVSPASTITYTITSTDANGCTQTETVTVNVNPLPNVTATSNILCAGENGQLVASGASSYLWSTGQTTASIVVSPPITTTYTVTGTHANGCKRTVTTQVTINPSPVLQTDSVAASCGNNNGSATVTVSGAGSTYYYSWSGGGGTNATASNLAPGTYSVTVTNANGCSSVETVQVIAQGVLSLSPPLNDTVCPNQTTSLTITANGTAPYVYSWNTGESTSSISVSPVSTSSYTVFVTDALGCSNSDTISVITQNILPLTSPLPDTVCPNQQTTIGVTANGTAPYTYSWNTGQSTASINITPPSASSYTVLVTDAGGCSNTDTIQVDVLPNLLSMDVSPASVICPGDTVSLFAAASGGNGNVVYSWDPVTSAAQGFDVSPIVSTTYTVNVTDACGFTTQQIIDVTVDPKPTALFSALPIPSCKTMCVNFTDLSTLSSGNITDWNWSFGDAAISTMQSPQHCYTSPGTYTVALQIKSDAGCVHDTTIVQTVNMAAGPLADFSFTPGEVDIDEPLVTFSNLSLGDSITWTWDFGDQNDSTTSVEKSPSHIYTETGMYCITLHVADTMGCVDSIVKCLEVKPNWTIYFPNTFTPNGDGRNDFFVGFGTGIISYEMWVFDRWGNEIFKCSTETDPQNSTTCLWDGKVQSRNGSGGLSGTLAQIDTYVWLVELRDIFQSPHRVVGHVNLLR